MLKLGVFQTCSPSSPREQFFPKLGRVGCWEVPAREGTQWNSLQVGKNGRNFPAAPGNGTRALSCSAEFLRVFLALPALHLAGKSHPHGWSLLLSPALPGLSPLPQQEFWTIWIPKAAASIGKTPCSGKGRGPCLTDTPSFVLPCWGTTSQPGPGLGSIPGVLLGVGWVEGKGEEDVNLGKRSGVL